MYLQCLLPAGSRIFMFEGVNINGENCVDYRWSSFGKK